MFWLTLPVGVSVPSDAMMVWKWGDGNQLAAAPLPFTGPATFSTSYQYSAPGHYSVQLVIYNLASSVTFTVPVSHFVVCPMLCICIGRNIKSRKRPSVRPSVRPASVDKNVTLFMDQFSPNLEHNFPISYRSKVFVCSSIGSSICACAPLNRPSLTAVKCLHQRFT